MTSRLTRPRTLWALFLGTWMALALVIRWHVRGLDLEVRREGLSSAAVVSSRKTLIDYIDIETGLRGYLITGQREYLRPYHEGLGRLDQHLADLNAAVSSLPHEQPYFESIIGLSRTICDEFATQIHVGETISMEKARQRFVLHPTKPTMDKIRVNLTTIQSEEGRRLAISMAELERSLATTIVLIDGFAAVSGLLLVAMSLGFINPPDQPSVSDRRG
jgi:methyl-accepting chemotaxis protein